MSSMQWFNLSPNGSATPDKPSTFWPATPSNPPLTTPAPAPPEPEIQSNLFSFPSEKHYSLHPPGYIYYPTSSQAKIYALSSSEEDRQALGDPRQDQYDWIHPFSTPVYKVPARCADVWNTVRWVIAGKQERGEGGELSAAMKRALVEVWEEEEG